MKIEKIGPDKYVCIDPCLTIITFDEIFKLVVIHVINMIYNIYGNLDVIQSLNTDVKKIFTYALLEQIYQRMIRENDVNNIFYLNTSFTTFFSEIWSYIDKDKLTPFIIKTGKTISRKAPLPIFIEDGIVDLTSDCGETCETINKLARALEKFKANDISLSKLKRYSKDNGLIQFIGKYHSEDDAKNNMLFNKYIKGASNEQV